MESETGIVKMTLATGEVIRGRPGLFMPWEKYKLEQLYESFGRITTGGGSGGSADFDLAFAGDLEGALIEDASGTKVAVLTIPDYEYVKEELQTLKTSFSEVISELADVASRVSALDASETSSGETNTEWEGEIAALKEQLQELQEKAAQVTSNVTEWSLGLSGLQERTDGVREDLEDVKENQLNYLRLADYSTVDGSILLIDGHGLETFTIGGTEYETVAAGEIDDDTTEEPEPSNPDD